MEDWFKEPYGYVTQSGYVGYVHGYAMLFATEAEYLEVISEFNEKEDE